jgi:glycosyltransferase involved in cell wall biosynthesis
MHFFCAQGFGFRDNKTCTKCTKGNYLNAIYNNCTGVKSLPSLIERFFLHKRALSANTFLSSNRTLDKILCEYKVPQKNIFNFPVPFDYINNSILESDTYKKSDNNYYIYYGQVNNHKGLKILQEVFTRLPFIKFKVLPMNFLNESTFESNNVEIINNVNWTNGLREYIINSKAVLIPSLWVTSTEYSLCEALLLKKPVVLFNIGMHKDIFINKENAMVAEPDDVDSYINSIIELEKDSELCKKLSTNGNLTLKKHNEIEKLTTELIKAYLN